MAQTGVQIWLALAVASVVMFFVATLLKKNASVTVSGTADIQLGRDKSRSVFFGVNFVVPPKLDLRFSPGYCDYEITEQAVDHFTILTDTSSGPTSFRWSATGVPSATSDSRSVWERLSLGQKIFSISTLITLIGLTADLIGIGLFVSEHVLGRQK
jgi:hypothetical protein